MGEARTSPRLEALHALLTSAQQLARGLKDDPTLPRVLQALASLSPDERATLAAALERGAAQRRINEGFAPLNGVRLRINPNPRLFMRVVDTEEPSSPPQLDEEDILPDVLRLMRRVPLLLAAEAQAVWRPAVEQALDMLSPRGRQACLRFAEDVLTMVASRVALDPTEPS
jgi:hypothetical protein